MKIPNSKSFTSWKHLVSDDGCRINRWWISIADRTNSYFRPLQIMIGWSRGGMDHQDFVTLKWGIRNQQPKFEKLAKHGQHGARVVGGEGVE
jgi:hypothetical protein